jgi:Fe-S cluster biogenesis protein NfuA
MNQEILVRVASTPNPNAWKFILDRPVLVDGKASYSSVDECFGNVLAIDLLKIVGVNHIHFFSNVITVTHYDDVDIDKLKAEVVSVIQTRLMTHNSNNTKIDDKKKYRESLSPDLQKIEEILDRTIRPGLQGDGGDIEVVKFEENKLYVFYQGACGTCPSSTQGTLAAIEGILRDEFSPIIEVIPV